MFVFDCGKAKDCCYETQITRVKMQHCRCHRDGLGDRYQPRKCYYRSGESEGVGGGRGMDAGARLRRPVGTAIFGDRRKKKNKTSTTSLKRVLPRLNLPPTKDEVVTYRMGWRQRGLPSFSMSENNKTAAMERTHSPTRQPRETRSKRREWLARDGRYDSR